MFPESETMLYPHIFQHIAAMKDEPYYAEALKRVGDTGVDLRRHLLSYVSLSFFFLKGYLTSGL